LIELGVLLLAIFALLLIYGRPLGLHARILEAWLL
jgi:hypothetical protein